MQDIFEQKISQERNFQEFSSYEKQKLVGVFVWLVEQDKKQNPALYKSNNIKND